MISLKRIVYYMDEATSEEGMYMSVRDLCGYFSNENCDYKTIKNRISSHMNAYRNMFAVKKVNARSFWRLSANGYRYLNKFKDVYNPDIDKLLFQPDKIEVI